MNLVIGNTSQQSYYYPDDYIKISSRDIDFEYLREQDWNSVYITFAEQRIYDIVDFMQTNYFYTLQILENLIYNSKRIIIFTSCELWNSYVGSIDMSLPFKYNSDNLGLIKYLESKTRLYHEILKRRKENHLYKNIIIIHPFNFNSVYRSNYFLFGKIFDSIINKKKIDVGNTYYYRDIMHTKYLVQRVMKADSDQIVGSGRLYFVNDFIRDLYKYFDMDYSYYVNEDKNIKNYHSEKLYYSNQSEIYTYNMLFNDTIEDIKKKIEK
jgi:nucleoside-diphosphate-sugar epimerase